MHREPHSRRVDRGIAALAARQHGVVARWQLLDLGVTAEQVRLRLSNGRLHEVHRGVYLVGHRVAPQYARESAAVLAARREGTLAGRTATALWGLAPYPPGGDVCLIIPPGRELRRKGIEVRRAILNRADIRRVHRLPVTGPTRTIMDVAAAIALEAGRRGVGARARRASGRRRRPRRAMAPRRLSELEQLVAQAEYLGLTSAAELAERLDREPGRRGARALRDVLGLPGGPQRTLSRPERRLISLLRRRGMKGFEANARIHGYAVDVLWRDIGFAVEIDGWQGHSGRVAFERDRAKLAHLSARGVDVMPLTPDELRRNPDAVLAGIESAVRHRRNDQTRRLRG